MDDKNLRYLVFCTLNYIIKQLTRKMEREIDLEDLRFLIKKLQILGACVCSNIHT